MNSDILKTAGAIIGLLVSGPFVYACIRAAMFFGAMDRTVAALQTATEGLSSTVDGLRTVLGDHGERIAAVETNVENLQRQPHAARTITHFTPEPSR